MIKRIGHEIAERIRNMEWADRVSGVVVPYEFTTSDQRKMRVPVSCDVSGKECTEEQLVQLLPDQRRRSVIFIEDRSGARRIGEQGPYVKFQGILRIVGWVNTEQIGADDGCDGCNTAYRISQEIYGLLPSRNTNLEDCNIVALNIDHYGYEKTGDSPWKEYQIGEERRSLILPPFEHFSMDLVAQWMVHQKCLASVVVNDPTGCGAPSPVRRRYVKDFTCDELLDPDTGITDEQLECLGCGEGSGSGSGSGSGGECDCDPLGYDLHNSLDEVILSGMVNEPCGGTLELTAPDAEIELVDAKGGDLGTTMAPSGKVTQITAPSATVQLQDSNGENLGAPITVHAGASENIEAPDTTIQLQDSGGANIGSADVYPAGTTTTKTAPDGVVTLNGSAYGNVKSGGTLDVEIDPITVTITVNGVLKETITDVVPLTDNTFNITIE